MRSKRWEFAVMVSNEGFGGIQFLNPSSEGRSGVMAILPKFRGAFKNLDETIKRIEGEGQGETENLRDTQSPGA